MNSQITYPADSDALLKSNLALRAEIDSAVGLVSEVLSVSKLPFFTDYTNHGSNHLNGVLEISDKLVSPAARQIFSAEDVAVLTFSILLHDLALHLSEGGFASLVKAGNNDWSVRWEEFLNEARHWDDRTLVALFGEDDSRAPRSLVKNPFDHYDNLNEADRKLIGEFIRRNHPQLARYFAEVGFPGVNGEHIKFDAFEKERRKLAGIVAWSHGTSLRNAIEVLRREQFGEIEFDRVHPVFLMGLLRISDFLELGPDRAPRIAFRYTDLKSPISRREWTTNQAFRKVSWSNPDSESITIPARPEDIVSFLELQKWLNAIQAELDTTWAVFGETFGSNPHFSKLGLTVRRVRSNILDDLEEFRRSSSFAPRRAALDVAGPQILKLFIEPLYGNHPEVGIRELIQNAVDAVRERKAWETKEGLLKPSDENDVEVWLDDPDENGVATLVVSDRGIGMTEDTVVNYFLTVGASFRRSIAWKMQFESEAAADHSTKIKSKILRSGRFGIGVLSGFLLGDEITVCTRHISSNRGIRLSIRLDLPPPGFETSPIQLNYDPDLPTGTTISVKVTRVKKPETSEKSESIVPSTIFMDLHTWDWYCLAEPKVVRFIGRQKKTVEQTFVLPSEHAALPLNWFSVTSSDYSTVLVLTSGDHKTYAPGLTCNGFKIAPLSEGLGLFFKRQDGALVNWQRDLFPREGMLKVATPQFSIFDPDGNLPLNLQRTGLTNLDLDFIKGAFEVQAKANLANLLERAPNDRAYSADFTFLLWKLFEPNELVPVVFTPIGIALNTPTNFRMLDLKKCLLLNVEAFREGWLRGIYPRYDGLFVAYWGDHGSSPIYTLRNFAAWMHSTRVITRSPKPDQIGKPIFKYKTHSEHGVSIYRSADCKPSLFEFEELKPLFEMPKTRADGESTRSFEDFIAAEIFLKDQIPFAEPTAMSIGRLWEKTIRESTIPYVLTERREKLAHAYTDLAAFIPSAKASSGKA